jgi:hypothetical protein
MFCNYIQMLAQVLSISLILILSGPQVLIDIRGGSDLPNLAINFRKQNRSKI